MEQYFFSYQHWLLQSLGPVAEQCHAATQLSSPSSEATLLLHPTLRLPPLRNYSVYNMFGVMAGNEPKTVHRDKILHIY